MRREGGADLFEYFAAEGFAFDGEAPALVVVEFDPAFAVRFFEHLIFSAQVFDHGLLIAIDPSGKGGQEMMPRL
jgi:hypothetical protein